MALLAKHDRTALGVSMLEKKELIDATVDFFFEEFARLAL
jgi:hypothetical protein